MENHTKTEEVPLKEDLLRGVAAIADFTGDSERRTYHLIATKQLPGVFKMGNRYCARKSTIRANIAAREQGAN